MNRVIDMTEIAEDEAAPNATGETAHAVDFARAPVDKPEGLATIPADKKDLAGADVTGEKKKNLVPVKWLGMKLPAPVSRTLINIHDFGQRARNATIHALPRKLVNHSSNVIASMQLVGEVMMFKANGTTLVPEQHQRTWWRYIVEPPKSIIKSVFQKAGGGGKDIQEVFTRDFYNKEKSILEAASLRDSLGGKNQLINRWQARSTFAGLTGMCLAALFPDVKDSPEDLEKRATMAHNNPLGYVVQTVGQALWFPIGTVGELGQRGWALVTGQKHPESTVGKNKRQFTGLGITVAGLCSFLSGFRNVKGNDYAHNGAHSVGGIITALAGSQLLLSIGSDQGWERFGSIQWLRMAFLPTSIKNRYTPNAEGKLENGRHWYAAGQAALQSTNTMSYLIGGAEKRADGSIVDHKAQRVAAKQHAIEAKFKHKQEMKTTGRSSGTRLGDMETDTLLETPSNNVSGVHAIEHAMPERGIESQQVTAG